VSAKARGRLAVTARRPPPTAFGARHPGATGRNVSSIGNGGRRGGESGAVLGAARAPQTGKKDAMSLSVEEMNKELPLANVLPCDAVPYYMASGEGARYEIAGQLVTV